MPRTPATTANARRGWSSSSGSSISIQRLQPLHHDSALRLFARALKDEEQVCEHPHEHQPGRRGREITRLRFQTLSREDRLAIESRQDSPLVKGVEQNPFVARDEMPRQIDSVDFHIRAPTDDYVKDRQRDRNPEPSLDDGV